MASHVIITSVQVMIKYIERFELAIITSIKYELYELE